MNEQHIEDIITTLYDTIQDAKSLPLASDKCIVERDKLLDYSISSGVLKSMSESFNQLPREINNEKKAA